MYQVPIRLETDVSILRPKIRLKMSFSFYVIRNTHLLHAISIARIFLPQNGIKYYTKIVDD